MSETQEKTPQQLYFDKLSSGSDPIHMGRIPSDTPAAKRWNTELTVNGGIKIKIDRDPLKLLDENEPQLMISYPSRPLEPVNKIDQIRLWNEKFGEWRYGQHPANYGTWAWHEMGGGGVVSVPYVIFNNELYIGVVRQKRYMQNQEEGILNIPRGFLQEHLNREQSVKEEASEEMDIDIAQLLDGDRPVGTLKARMHQLPGHPTNGNNAFHLQDSKAGEGNTFYAIEFLNVYMTGCFGSNIPPHQVRLRINTEFVLVYDGGEAAKKQFEGILGAEFIHHTQVYLLGDKYSIVGAARLFAHLQHTQAQRLMSPQALKDLLRDPEVRKILAEE